MITLRKLFQKLIIMHCCGYVCLLLQLTQLNLIHLQITHYFSSLIVL